MKATHPTLTRDWSQRLPWSIIINLLLAYACYGICRVAFLMENYSMFGPDLSSASMWRMARGVFLFDSSAIFYTNALYLLMALLPLRAKEKPLYHSITKWVFVVVNSSANALNLADCVYYAFTLKRTTVLVLDEFSGNTNIAEVIGIELLNHWYLVLLFIALTIMLIKCYRDTRMAPYTMARQYYVSRAVWLVVFALVAVCGMRGDVFRKSSRPLAMSNAHQYVDKTSLTALVINTPFSVIRTAAKHQINIPKFFDSPEELAVYYSAVHLPNDSVTPQKKNVVILIVESLAEEFIGARNRDLDGGTYKGYTPFVDSLLQQSTTFDHTYSNGWISIDAMPSVLSSVPKMYNAFVVTPYALDDVPGIAKELGDWGYTTAFFHGAENSSMGFQAYARSAGFGAYHGRTEYDADPRFGGENDYDGTWAIWDEEFLQYMCAQISDMQPPFLAAVFTATSHHPFALPERYKEVYPDEGAYPIHKCVRYTDNALRLFFEAAKRQPWYDNTIFVITADHASSRITHDVYRTDVGDYRVPIIFFDPSGQLAPGTRPGIAQQIDIMPTLLSYLGYDKPYVAFGKDMLSTAPEDSWAFNYHNIPQLLKGDYLLKYNDFTVSGIYNVAQDSLLQHNLAGTDLYDKAFVAGMENQLKAILQDVDTKMKNDQLRYPNLNK